MPTFDLNIAELWIAVARSLTVVAVLSAFGAAVFLNVVAPAALRSASSEVAENIRRRILVVVRFSLFAAIAASLGWLAIESVAITVPRNFVAGIETIPTLLSSTSFGHVVAFRIAVCLAALLAFSRVKSRARIQFGGG